MHETEFKWVIYVQKVRKIQKLFIKHSKFNSIFKFRVQNTQKFIIMIQIFNFRVKNSTILIQNNKTPSKIQPRNSISTQKDHKTFK
jgi:hypothetical protein